MKNVRKNGLSDFQLVAVTFVAASGVSTIFLPRTVAEGAGRDGWIGIILAGLVALTLAGLIYLLCRRFPKRILPEFSMLILGKPLGILVSAVYIIYTLLLSGTNLMLFVEVSKTWAMFWTPQWFLIAMLLVPVLYIVRQGPVPLGRLTELIFYSIMVVGALLLMPLPQFNMMNLRPLGDEGITVIARAAGQTTLAFLGFEVLLVFFPLTIKRQGVLRLYLLAVALLIAFFTSITLLTFGVLGVEYTRLQVWPLMIYLGAGRMQVIERLDNLFLFLWIAKIIGLVALQYYAAVITGALITGKRHFDLWILLLFPVLYGIAYLPGQHYVVFQFANLVGSWGAVFVAGLVLLLFLVALIRGIDESEETG